MKSILEVNWKSKQFFLFILFLQFMFFVTVFFNISIARQVLGFFYFTFLPGFIVVKLLKLGEFNWVETVLFSVGFSIVFLMIAGLLINEFGLLFGVSQPLSLVPLMTVLNSLILMGGVLVFLKSEDVEIRDSKSIIKSPFVLLFLCLPILSIVGTMYVTTYGSNFILLFMIMAVSLLFVIGVLSKKLLLPKFYPFAVFMIAIALLFHSSFISQHIVTFGSDVTGEYFAFKTTENSAYWNSTNPYYGGDWVAYGRFSAMLSVTILPTIYSTLLNINPVWMFKVLFPLIFSLVPLALYQIWRGYIGKKYAFISSFLFMAQSTFYTEMLGLNRQMIAELFFVLLLLVTLNKRMRPFNKTVCFIIFSFALVTSHYAIAEIFLLFITCTLVSLIVLKRPSKNITRVIVVFFFTIMFVWYIYTCRAATFYDLMDLGDYVYSQLGQFFNPTSRGQTVLRGLGMEAPPSIWNSISRMFAYLTQAFIVAGFVGLITKRVKTRLDIEYFLLNIIAMAFLTALIAVPGLANTLNITRFYHILLFFLAPLCVLGAETIMNFLSKREMETKVSFLLLMVLVPYFLFQTEFVFEVTGSDSWSVPLSKYRFSPLRLYGHFGYTDAYNVFGAQWLSNNVAVGHTGKIYACYCSRSDLRAYGLVYMGYIEILSNTTEIPANGIVYLRSLNTIEGTVVGVRHSWNTSELNFLHDLNKIYSNVGSELYKNVKG